MQKCAIEAVPPRFWQCLVKGSKIVCHVISNYFLFVYTQEEVSDSLRFLT